MNLERNQLDSELLAMDVWSLRDFAVADDLSSLPPGYIVCKVPARELAAVHALEAAGFRFAELQFRLGYSITRALPVPKQFQFLPAAAADLEAIGAIADQVFAEDRMRLDPEIDPAVARRRYRGYIRHAFESQDQRVYKTVDRDSGELLAFKTHKLLPDGKVLLLLGGAAPAWALSGAGQANSRLEINHLFSQRITRLTTHVSASNHAILNLEVGKAGFRVEASFVVMRRLR